MAEQSPGGDWIDGVFQFMAQAGLYPNSSLAYDLKCGEVYETSKRVLQFLRGSLALDNISPSAGNCVFRKPDAQAGTYFYGGDFARAGTTEPFFAPLLAADTSPEAAAQGYVDTLNLGQRSQIPNDGVNRYLWWTRTRNMGHGIIEITYVVHARSRCTMRKRGKSPNSWPCVKDGAHARLMSFKTKDNLMLFTGRRAQTTPAITPFFGRPRAQVALVTANIHRRELPQFVQTAVRPYPDPRRPWHRPCKAGPETSIPLKRIAMIKHIAIALLASVVVQTQAQAQQSSPSSESRMDFEDTYTRPTSALHLIPIAGLNFVALKAGDHTYNADPGGTLGGLVDIGSRYVQFESGLLFNSYSSSTTYTFTKVEFRRDYLSVPVLGKVNIMGNPDRTVYLKAGVMPSWTTAKKGKATVFGVETETSDVPFKSFDLPAVFGVGGAIHMAQNKSLFVEGTYMRSTSSIDSSKEDRGDIRNEGLAITCGFSFGI